jgi:hypothetical protein
MPTDIRNLTQASAIMTWHARMNFAEVSKGRSIWDSPGEV